MEEIKFMKLTIGEKIALLRREKGKTQDDLARHLDVSLPKYISMEDDFLYPSDLQIAKIGELYGMSYDQVISYGED
ncbi:transcriptional regulator with XRE-family HTH domain [Pedobacter africanus]|uniref:Transcriptional regulator with XRE-family HTH domain n=1 Tax=Pedobacter africanus TaxID=151894 RepID=A0ACC6KXD3_9SPHI|nr:helix-turn-helix transcriptional regulator [Pedobacter africanus]MDR6783773.1 transcriptional regulator with XRE-family HTH domain [Pedobacter africanus]